MNRRHPLITHPVGRLSAAARWYLAGITMLALVLISIHFAMQVYAQQEAKRLVSSWVEDSGISVGSVRYRMLRGTLTLVDVRLKRHFTDIHAPAIFLHGSLTSLGGESLKAGYIEIRGARITLPAKSALDLVNGESAILPNLFYHAWRSAQRTGIYDSYLKILSGTGEQLPSGNNDISIVQLEAKQFEGRRETKGSFKVLDGELKLISQASGEGMSAPSTGRISWDRIDAASFFTRVMGLQAFPGSLNGQMEWQANGTENGSYSLTGAAEIEGRNVAEKTQLDWQGLLVSKAWIGEIKATSWPLAPFSEKLPQYQRYSVASGNLNGVFKFAGDWQDWKIETADTWFTNVEFDREEEGELLPEWRLGELHLSDASLHWPDRNLRAEKVSVDGFDFVSDARGIETAPRNWNIDVKEVTVKRVTPSIILTNELFRLPELSGTARWHRGDNVSFELQSSDSNGVEEGWKIHGEGSLHEKSENGLKIDVSSNNAALVRFRPLLPDLLRRDASSISGTVNLELRLSVGSLPWEGSGTAELSNLYLQYGGEQLSAKHVALNIEQTGVAIPEQLIKQVDIESWSYQVPLRPIAQLESNDPGVDDMPGSKAEPWHIKSLQMNDGRVMVGNAEAVWLQGIEIKVENLRPGSAGPIDLKAAMGDGTLAVQGSLYWDTAMPGIHKAKVIVRDALPFFMNDWLWVSGLPQIMRGRMYADLKLAREADGNYRGLGYFRLQDGELGSDQAGKDLFLSRAGFNTHDIFASLNDEGSLRIRVPLKGGGKVADVLGSSFVAALKRDMEKRGRAGRVRLDSRGSLLSSVRLHENGVLSYNERVRLRKVLTYLRKNPKVSIELYPQLAMNSVESIQVERVRYTQRLIEEFLAKRGVHSSRIFPVWPGEQHRNSSSTSGIDIVTLF